MTSYKPRGRLQVCKFPIQDSTHTILNNQLVKFKISKIPKLRNETLKLVQTHLSSGIEVSELRNAKDELVHMQKQSSDTGILEFRKTK